MKKEPLKKFIVRKYIWATSATQAIKKDKKHPVEEVWIDEDFRRTMSDPSLNKSIGFKN